MLKELKFVAGAVAKKDFLPAMTHFVIEDGFVRSFNGVIAICAPIPFEINCKPKATTLVKVIDKCKETASMSMTSTGRLSIRSGSFRALIDCVEESPVHVMPEGEQLEIDGAKLVSVFAELLPIVGDDASRPWSNGVLLHGASAYATCNVVLVEKWLGVRMPRTLCIPAAAIKEVLRVGEPPTHAQCDDKSFTFHYPDGRWIRTQLLDASAWPDVGKVLQASHTNNAKPVDARIFEAIDNLKPFTDKEDRIIFKDGIAATHYDEEAGARFDMGDCNMKGVYAIPMLDLLRGMATTADFTTFPSPCSFYGDMLRGVIVGRKA